MLNKTILFFVLLIYGQVLFSQDKIDYRSIYFDESETDSSRLHAL